MRRQTEFKKDMRHKPPSPSPRFSRTFDLLLSRFPDSTNFNNTPSLIMASYRSTFPSSSSDEKSGNKPGQWRASGSSPLCALCNKTVYPAEEVVGAGQKFHKLCLKCTTCNTLLNSGNLNERNKKIYCVPCYRRQFGPRGVGRGLATSFLSNLETPPSTPNLNRSEADMHNDDDDFDRERSIGLSSSTDDSRRSHSVAYLGGAASRQAMMAANRSASLHITKGSTFKILPIPGNICPRCSLNVYSAEEVKAAGKSYHKRCYTCAHCRGSISGGRYSERHGELYDNNCYQRLFGPRGVGFGIGAGALSTGK